MWTSCNTFIVSEGYLINLLLFPVINSKKYKYKTMKSHKRNKRNTNLLGVLMLILLIKLFLLSYLISNIISVFLKIKG